MHTATQLSPIGAFAAFNQAHRPTRRSRLAAIIAVGTSLAVPLSAQAATTLTPKWPEAAPAKEPISISDWSWGLEHRGNFAPGTSGAASASFTAFRFTKPVDATSPLFLNAVATGQGLESVRLNVPAPTSPKGAPALELCMSQVYVRKDVLRGGNGPTPTEEIELQFDAVTEVYRTYDSGGNLLSKVLGGWDQVLNTSFTTGC
jgi:type VI protein secretion system component Hcp